jgi:hypothetical protein
MADQPNRDQIARIEGEVEEGGEFAKELRGQILLSVVTRIDVAMIM